MVHLRVGQLVLCGKAGESMSVDFYKGHVLKEDCCSELRERVCSECRELSKENKPLPVSEGHEISEMK